MLTGFFLRSMGEFTLKGKENKVVVHEVLGSRSASARPAHGQCRARQAIEEGRESPRQRSGQAEVGPRPPRPSIRGGVSMMPVAIFTHMITVQMTLERDLVKAVDRLAKRRGLSRSAFTREALTRAIEAETFPAQEERHRKGYIKHPVRAAEFHVPAGHQAWPD
jgi:hypothetical protein